MVDNGKNVYFSIITVCFNEEDAIGKTIESVLAQSYPYFEYIVCDGGSSDKTFQIVESYKDAFARKNIRYTISSQKDGGIYFGMNNGIDLAQRDYLHFLNAGDLYHDGKVLEIVASGISREEADIYYGDIFVVERGFGKRLVCDASGLDEGMSICHQSMFIKTDLMKQKPYNTDYRIVADYDFTLAMKQSGRKFCHVDCLIADYRAGGVSTTQVDRIAKEYYTIKEKAGLPADHKVERKVARKNKFAADIKAKMPRRLWEKYSISKGHIRVD